MKAGETGNVARQNGDSKQEMSSFQGCGTWTGRPGGV